MILSKKDANRRGNYNEGACTIFIPKNHVAASGVAVTEALSRGFHEETEPSDLLLSNLWK